jgi:hypothetical protein
MKSGILHCLTLLASIVVATKGYGSEYRRDLYATVGNWQIVRTKSGNSRSCLIQNIYNGHSQLGFGLFGQPAATRLFLYGSDLGLKPGTTGSAEISLVGLPRNSFASKARYVAQEKQLARITMGSPIYQKMLTLRDNNDTLQIRLAGRSYQFNLAGTIDVMPDYMRCLNELP